MGQRIAAVHFRAGHRREARNRVTLSISRVKSSFVSLSNATRLDFATANTNRASAQLSAFGFGVIPPAENLWKWLNVVNLVLDDFSGNNNLVSFCVRRIEDQSRCLAR